MEEWKEYKLKEVTSVLGDGIHGTPKYDDNGSVFFINGNNLENGRIVIKDTTKRVSEREAEKYKKPLCDRTLMVSINGTLGNVARYNGEPCILGKSACFFNVKEDFEKDFIYYVVNNQYFRNEIERLATGTTIKNVSLETMRNYSFLVPSLDIQRRIASILSSLDDKIELNRKINANLEAQAQALFKSWFVDFEPFKDQPFIESELGMIPVGWRVGNIYEYIDVIYGAPYKSSLFNENKDGLPLIRIRDLKTNAPQFYTPELLPNTEYINAGDIVAGMDAEFIPYVWLGERGVLNQRCCKFKGKNDAISNYYIRFLIKPELEYVQSYKTGTTVSHLGKSDIDRFKLMTPPLDVVLAFSERVNPMKEEVVNRAKESRRLASLRDALLPRLMSGELKVNEVI